MEVSLPPASGPDGPLTPTIDYIYNDASELATRMDPPVNGGFAQRETDYTHDGLGRLTGVSLPTVAAGTPETEYRYDRAGNLRFTVDAKQLDVWGSAEDAIDAGAVTENIYDSLNRLVETIGQEVTITASNGTTSDASPTVHYKYDAAGHGRVVIDSNGQSTVSVYNEQNQLVSVQQPDPDGGGSAVGTLTTYQRDLAGNTIRSTQTTGSGVYNYVTVYDSLNRPIKATDPLDNYVETTYNADGTVYSTQTFDSAGTATAGETVYGYNAVGDQTSVVAPLDSETTGTTAYGYNRVGNLRQLTDLAGNITYYTYDGLRDQTSESYTIGSETLTRYYKYDASGDIVHETDRNGREIDYVFDDLQQVTSETWTDEATSDTVNTSYDLLGRVHTVSDDFSSYTYEYDDLNRVISVDNSGTPGVTDVVLHSGYDSNGNRTRSAATINGTADFENLYGYNADNTLAFVTQHAQDSGNAVGYKRVELGYNSANRLSGITRYASTGTGDLVADTSLTYDLAGRLETMSTRDAALTLLAGYQWHYDDKSRIDSFYSANDGTVAYQYDQQDQLTDATYSYTVTQQNEHYDYDANGNRTAVTFDAGLETEDVRDYDTPSGSQNRIFTDGVNYYTFDGEGNRIRKTNIADGPVTVYEWDVRNRLVKVTTYHNTTDADNEADPTQVVTNTYDVFNRWIGRQVDSDGDETIDHTDRFVYDGNQIVLTYSNDSDAANAPTDLSHRYLWGNAVDQLFADEQEIESLVAEGRTLWALTDNLGTVRDMVEYNSTGHTTDNANHIAYASFGEITRETNTGAIQQSNYYTGKFLDKATGLQNNINRWYEASTGQWTTADPANADVNTYRYASNDPINRIDPEGTADFPLVKWNGSTYTQTIKAQGSYGQDIAKAAEQVLQAEKAFPGAKALNATWHHKSFNKQTGEFLMELVEAAPHKANHSGGFAEYLNWVAETLESKAAIESLSPEMATAVIRTLKTEKLARRVESRLADTAIKILTKRLEGTGYRVIVTEAGEVSAELVGKKVGKKLVGCVVKTGAHALPVVFAIYAASSAFAETGEFKAAAEAAGKDIVMWDLVEGTFKLTIVNGAEIVGDATIKPNELAGRRFSQLGGADQRAVLESVRASVADVKSFAEVAAEAREANAKAVQQYGGVWGMIKQALRQADPMSQDPQHAPKAK